jgi:hypothetical protein
MTLDYELKLEDHLAWYNAYLALFPPTGMAGFPIFGAFIARNRRNRFMRGILSADNHLALGRRSIELSARGAREFNECFDFFMTWQEYTLVVLTDDHVFLAHPNMNARIIPLRACPTHEAKQDLLALIERCSKASPPIRKVSN